MTATDDIKAIEILKEEQDVKARIRKAQSESKRSESNERQRQQAAKQAAKQAGGNSTNDAKRRAVNKTQIRRAPRRDTGNKPNYAILRHKKLKSFAEISRVGSHNMRQQKTPNADPSKTPGNRLLRGSGDVLADVKNRIGERFIRKNAVLADEHILTASGSWFRPTQPDKHGAFEEKRLAAFEKRAMAWLDAKYGVDNIVSAITHTDERSCHIQAVVVPIDFDKDPRGKLNARKFWGGKSHVLEAFQDDFASYMKPLGLVRGKKKSKARYVTTKEYAGRMNQPVRKYRTQSVDEPDFIAARLNPKEYAQDQVTKATMSANKYIKDVEMENRQLRLVKERFEQSEIVYADNRALADQMRDLDLIELSERLGYVMKSDGIGQFKVQTPAGEIVVNAEKFYDHNERKGGGGAIDFLMKTENIKFKDAVQFLSGKYGADRAVSAATVRYEKSIKNIASLPKALIMPPLSEQPEAMQKVYKYLTQERGLDPKIVDKLHKAGDLYATDKRCNGVNIYNAVFVARDSQGEPVGAEIISTGYKRFKGVALGSNPALGVMKVTGRDAPKKPKKLVFCESAIDAISYVQLNPSAHAISCGGVRTEYVKNHLGSWFEDSIEVACGFDNDRSGRAGAKFFAQLTAGEIKHEIPIDTKDWNDFLKKTNDEAAGKHHKELECIKNDAPNEFNKEKPNKYSNRVKSKHSNPRGFDI